MYRKPDKEVAIRRPEAEVMDRRPDAEVVDRRPEAELAARQLLPGHPVPVTPSSGPVTVTLAFFICYYLLILKMFQETRPIISSSVNLQCPQGADSPLGLREGR